MKSVPESWDFDPQDWIGRAHSAGEVVGPELVRRFNATVGRGGGAVNEGEPAPFGIHWCIAPSALNGDQLGADGHPRKGIVLPPIPVPHRMWAGSDIEFLKPIRIGDRLNRVSTIESIERKEGRSGELCFVKVKHVFSTGEGEVLHEHQNIVYRDATIATPGQAVMAELPKDAVTARMKFDTLCLFRYSALTFNGHRIHYDLPYATEREGYPGLVVHGPLQATLLMHMASDALGGLGRFEFRGTKVLICGQEAVFWSRRDAEGVKLGIIDASGAATMVARGK